MSSTTNPIIVRTFAAIKDVFPPKYLLSLNDVRSGYAEVMFSRQPKKSMVAAIRCSISPMNLAGIKTCLLSYIPPLLQSLQINLNQQKLPSPKIQTQQSLKYPCQINNFLILSINLQRSLMAQFDINFKYTENPSMSELQISEIWSQINQILQLDCGRFSIKQLSTRSWYLQVLDIIFPDLNEKLLKIQDIQSEQAAIDRMLLLMTQEEIIEEDFLEIKGANIVNGHKESIFYVVQLFMALVEKALEQAENQEQNGQGEEYDQQFDEENQEQEAKNDFKQEVANYKAQMLNMANMANMPNKAKKTNEGQYSDRKDERQRHSVQGIGHQFEPQQQQQYEEEEEQEEQQFHHNFDDGNHQQAFKNVFPQNQNSEVKGLKQTNIYNNNEEDQGQQNYLQQKLQKHKSQDHFRNIEKKKSPKQSKMHETQKVRKLVSHPQIPKKYPKATTVQEKKLTKDVKKTIKNSRKRGQTETTGIHKVTSAQHLQKKKRQLNQYMSSTKKTIKNDEKYKKTGMLKQKNQQKLKKLLKWKQANLRRQKQQLEQDMEMKVQLKKELYIKKINKLILNLEKNRIIEKKKQEKQRERKQKELANRRLQAIEQQYKTQMKLLHEKSQEKLGKKVFANTDHRQIIEGLERQLKKQNEKQLINLKMKFRREEAQLQDDLQKLQSEIIKTYKRN